MSEIAEDLREAYGHAIAARSGFVITLIERVSAAETALALAKAERDRQHEFNVGLILRIAVLESKLAQEKAENARLKAPVSDEECCECGHARLCHVNFGSADCDACSCGTFAARSKAPDGAQEAEGK